MITLYGTASPNVVKVMLMLSELDLAYDFMPVKVAKGEQYTPGFVALNPNSKVPVIVDSDGPDGRPFTVFESGAILVYLADKTGRFLPTAPAARSIVLQWLFFQMANIGPMFGQAIHFRYIAPADDYARRRYTNEVERLYDVLERRLESVPYLGGGDYSVADIAAFPWAGRYAKTLGIDLEPRPQVRDWAARIEARPAHQRIAEFVKTSFKQGLAEQKTVSPEDLDRFYLRTRPQVPRT
jgi:GST-like protein